MALSGLEIYKHLPKNNCKKCGFPTCLAFAMQLAQRKVALDICPVLPETAKKALEESSQPPIRLISFGAGDNKIEVGNETVLFRHEQTFHHPPAIAVLLEAQGESSSIKTTIEDIAKLNFERVGQKIAVGAIAIKACADNNVFLDAIKKSVELSDLALILICSDPNLMKDAVSIAKDRLPLLYGANKDNFQAIVPLAKENHLPLVASAPSLDELVSLTKEITALGFNDIILDCSQKGLSEKLYDLTLMRRLALKKNFRALGFPPIAQTTSVDAYDEIQEAITYVCKYAGVIITKLNKPWQILPILTARQNIYTDPQKPLQVESKVYKIGAVNANSPVLITTNFSLSYYTVESEVEASKVPSYIISVDSDGMSVLTAWAAEKFTPEKITAALKNFNMESMVSKKEIIIPGYVSTMSGKLEEESGWKVIVGPREASGIPVFLKKL